MFNAIPIHFAGNAPHAVDRARFHDNLYALRVMRWGHMSNSTNWLAILAIIVSAAGLSAALVAALSVLLPRTFLTARITARSNHQTVARQIGGIAVTPAALAVALTTASDGFPALLIAILLTFAVGLLDDAFDLRAALKGLVLAVTAALALCAFHPPTTSATWQYALFAFAFLFLFYWINAANFMDGLDLMEVVGIGLPLSFCSTLLLTTPGAPDSLAILGLALCGALAGFAVFNIPPARVFLGDSGSLVCGLVSGCVIIETAVFISLPIAVLPFLYFFADTLSTLAIRLVDGENIFQAHSRHAYQVARRTGMSSQTIVMQVGLLTLLLCALSLAVEFVDMPVLRILAIALAFSATAWLVIRFRAGGKKGNPVA
jgi:UDP-N-acetylmuramyl pentapeptide phosphotransferase/UDP-N-acetylglucosamine-1-phosphate transferase